MYKARVNYDSLTAEDVPYYDLTGMLVGLGDEPAEIYYFTREDCTVCGTEEAAEIFRRNGLEVIEMMPSGETAGEGAVLLKGRGGATDVFTAWKPAQNLIDHLSGIATKTGRMVSRAHGAKPGFPVMSTRKMFPGTKALAVKAVLAGGGTVHRLGLSETVLIFKQHMNIIGGEEALIAKLPKIKQECCEKKVFIEAENTEAAEKFLAAGADGIQFDKVKPAELKAACERLREKYPYASLTAAGGINEANVAEYAASGVDGVVTTSIYTAEPIDIGTKINRI